MGSNSLPPLPPRRRGAIRRSVALRSSKVFIAAIGNIVYPLVRRARRTKPPKDGARHLLIGAGVKGWELIEYTEIYKSASEYLGTPNVSKVVFSGNRPMLAEFQEALREAEPSHYYFDPRSGSQKLLGAIWEALAIGVHLERAGVIPICALTDFPVKRWRLQTAIVSARHGVVTSLMSPSVVGPLFPHQRIIGPMPFPLSVATLRRLEKMKRRNISRQSDLSGKVVFVGMLYEPRKTTIEAIQRGLAQQGIPMEIIGRMPDGSRISDDEYWDIISEARLIVSTSSQIASKQTDFDGHNHFIYKFIEVTAAGTALAIEPVEGSEHLLRPDVDYIAYSSVDEAVAKIAGAWTHPKRLNGLAKKGNSQTRETIMSAVFWRNIFSSNP